MALTYEEALDALVSMWNSDEDTHAFICVGFGPPPANMGGKCTIYVEVDSEKNVTKVVDRKGMLPGNTPTPDFPAIDDTTVADIKQRLDSLSVPYTGSMLKADLYDLLVNS